MLSSNKPMTDDERINQMVDDIAKVLDGSENALAVQALMTSLVIIILMGAPPNTRDAALRFVFKTMREMIKMGTKSERTYMQ